MAAEASNQKRVFVTDCEGPISKNDNAFELAAEFVPKGDNFFALISKYDDILADIVKKLGYKAGDTLRLIVPFLKAYGVTGQKMRTFSSKNVLLVPGAKNTLQLVQKLMPSFIVSTSYEQYIAELCELTDFPFSNAYCTRLNLDKYEITTEETSWLKQIQQELAGLPQIQIPKGAVSVADFSGTDQQTIKRLDEIFWKELPKTESGKMLVEVNPVGGTEKARSVEDIVTKLGCGFGDVMYVGDSITDAPALCRVREGGGLAVSFNGNDYSVREADVAVLSGNTVVTSVLAQVFSRFGKEKVLQLVESWGVSGLEKFGVSAELRVQMQTVFGKDFPQVELVTGDSLERLQAESKVFRKTVRGEAIGKLG